MDIRFVNKDFFKIKSEGLVYFTDNSLIGERSNALIDKAGSRILDTIQKINGCATGEVKITPGYNLIQDYVILSVLPDKIDNDLEIKLMEHLLKNLFDLSEEYNISSLAIDVQHMQTKYGDEYITLLNQIIRSDKYKYNNNILYLCKEM